MSIYDPDDAIDAHADCDGIDGSDGNNDGDDEATAPQTVLGPLHLPHLLHLLHHPSADHTAMQLNTFCPANG